MLTMMRLKYEKDAEQKEFGSLPLLQIEELVP
jgi:hypothetical protein